MLIVVEGCVGVGKSTVAKGLAAFRGGQVLLEDFEANPFLAAFYDDPSGHAIETEFTFLLLHYHQLKSIHCRSGSEVVADFHLGKDLLYADLNIEEEFFRNAFRDLYIQLCARVPKEVLMVCLSASDSLLLKRIQQRKRAFELGIEAEYLAKVNAKYEELYARYSGRKLRISMDEWDFVQNPDLFRKLSRLVDEELKG